ELPPGAVRVMKSGMDVECRHVTRSIQPRCRCHFGAVRQRYPAGLAALSVAQERTGEADRHLLAGDLQREAAKLPAGVEQLQITRLERKRVWFQCRRRRCGPGRVRQEHARVKTERGQNDLSACAGGIKAETKLGTERRQG